MLHGVVSDSVYVYPVRTASLENSPCQVHVTPNITTPRCTPTGKNNPLHKLLRIALAQTLPKRSIGKFFPFVLRYEWHSGKRWKFRDSNPGLSGYEPDVLTN